MASGIGRPRKADNLKVLAGRKPVGQNGNAHASITRAPEPIPQPPDWLPIAARGEFARLSVILAARGTLGEKVVHLANYCALGATIAHTFGAGRNPTGSVLTQHRSLARLLDISGDNLRIQDGPPRENRFYSNWALSRGKK
jgi:hypothetical protein